MSAIDPLAPDEWPAPPKRFSATALEQIRVCPHRYQLLRGKYGSAWGMPMPPGTSAIAGRIVHEALSEVLIALGKAGNPELGSPDFQGVLASLNLKARLAELREAELTNARKGNHPRAPHYQFPVGLSELRSHVFLLLRATYRKGHSPWQVLPQVAPSSALWIERLQRKGLLSEVELSHASLPLMGIIDLVKRGETGTELIDFKTGRDAPDAHQRQLELYALLWADETQDVPVRLTRIHPEGEQSSAFGPDQLVKVRERIIQELADAESILRQFPAPANVGEHCSQCIARLRCASFWNLPAAQRRGERDVWDLQLTPLERPSATWLTARLLASDEVVSIVFDPIHHATFSTYGEASTLRILNAQRDSEGTVLVGPRAEVWPI